MPFAPKVVSQILSRPYPLGRTDCGPCATFEALYLASGGKFKIGGRARRASVIETIRSRGGMGESGGTGMAQQVAAVRSFTSEFAALGLAAPHIQLLLGVPWSTFRAKLEAGKWAIVSVDYGPIDAYHDHAISGTWGFVDGHAAVAGDLRSVDGVEVVTWVDPLDDGRWSVSSHMDHAGYVPRGPIDIPLALLQDALLAYHGAGRVTAGVFAAAGVIEDDDDTPNPGDDGTSDTPEEARQDYPGRGAWSFTNLTQGFDFWPTLTSVSISDGRPDELATFSAQVIDQAGTLVFGNEDEIRVEYDDETIFAGDLVVPAGGYLSRVGPRLFDLTCQDFTARLDDNVIDQRGNRKHSESIADRVAWIMSFSTRGIGTARLDLPAGDAAPNDYTGMTVREALDQVASDANLFFYVDFDLELHLFRSETETAAFGLDDSAPDYAATFPFWDFRLEPDSTDLHDRSFVQGAKTSEWVEDTLWTAAHGVAHQERAISDGSLRASQLLAAGQRDLATASSPLISGSLAVAEPGLVAGSTVHILPALFPGWEADYIITSIDSSAIDPHDEGGNAQLRAQISFKDRRAKRRGHVDQTNTLTRGRIHSEGAGLVLGAAVALEPFGLYSHTWYDGFFDFGPGLGFAASYVGPNTAWILAGCDVGVGGWGPGREDDEAWFLLQGDPIGERSVGLTVTIGPGGSAVGVAVGGNMVIGVAHADPTAPRQYEAIATLPVAVGGTAFVPRCYIQEAGPTYIVIAPAWLADEGFFACAERLAWPANGPVRGGEGNSGQFSPPAISVTETLFESGPTGDSGWVPGIGPSDGTNATFTLIAWDGTGTPEARVGIAILGAGDYTVDPDAGSVTFVCAPYRDADVRFRYSVEAT